jgi:hypothetical protein
VDEACELAAMLLHRSGVPDGTIVLDNGTEVVEVSFKVTGRG